MRHEVRQSSAFGRRLGHRKIFQHRKRVGQQNLGSYLRTNQILAQSVWHTLCQGAGEYTARRDTSQITALCKLFLLCIIVMDQLYRTQFSRAFQDISCNQPLQ